MKFGYQIVTHEVSKENVTGLKGEYEDLFALLKDTGFTGVELMVKNPFMIDFNLIGKLAGSYGLDVVMFCTGEVYGEDGVCFAAPEEEVRSEAKKRTLKLLQEAETFGANVNVGRLRGAYVPGVAPVDTLKWVREGLLETSRACPGAKLLIEPIHRKWTNLILTTQEGLAFVKELNAPNVGLMLDIDHMTLEQEDIPASIKEAKGYFHHVHVCDTMHQCMGKGSNNFAEFLGALKAVDYDGYVTVEVFPAKNQQEEVRESYRILREYL